MSILGSAACQHGSCYFFLDAFLQTELDLLTFGLPNFILDILATEAVAIEGK